MGEVELTLDDITLVVSVGVMEATVSVGEVELTPDDRTLVVGVRVMEAVLALTIVAAVTTENTNFNVVSIE